MNEFVRIKAIRILVNDNIISQLGFKSKNDFDDFDEFVREKCLDFSVYEKDENGE